MGCVHSIKKKSPKKNSLSNAEDKIYSWDIKQKIDPKDFIIENQSDVTLGRLPGAVNGEQFIIQNCQNCNIFVFDWANTITVDDCVDCNIFLGPTKGSIFIRDCKDCRLVAACQQFRARDCKRIDSYLCCATQPSIETCSGMRFGCLCYYYPELEFQFKKAGASIFNNSWSEIHDFTPAETERNWKLVWKDAVKIENILLFPNTEELSQVKICSKLSSSAVPQTLGCQKKRSDEQSCLVLFFTDDQTQKRTMSFIMEMGRTNIRLIRTKEVSIGINDAQRLFGNDLYDEAVQLGPVIGLEYNGDDAIDTCQNTAKTIETETGSIKLVYVSVAIETAIKQVDRFFNYADMHLSM